MKFQKELKDSIRKALPELDVVIGWCGSFDPLHATPHFIRREEDIEKLEIGPLSVHNLATYLPGLRGKKVGIVVKGCDSRSVIELLQEKLIARDDITIFGFPCTGVVDQAKIKKALGYVGNVESCDMSDKSVVIVAAGKAHSLELSDVLADKCHSCRYPDAIISDIFVGDKSGEAVPAPADYEALATFENLSLPDRFGFWLKELDRCIRCYACRSACPLCVCRDHCAAESREPHWLSQENNVRDKLMFQVIHAYHLAGRCTECGECQRACPVDIPVLMLKQKMNKEIRDIFKYEAGVDPEETPPLLSFKMEEENITEKDW
ncbi:MAG: 4Fe-4S dicluster domain-containing protein [Proteobacteria bacterium]|nr:4Fe-4S dicluster domain-containing protein [Pseudomonadota bacterium]MBU1060384.1 4Fe-4S dicluster domain-containing protein [Pseudomonadota bacterium]